jgi:hypothetical protein
MHAVIQSSGIILLSDKISKPLFLYFHMRILFQPESIFTMTVQLSLVRTDQLGVISSHVCHRSHVLFMLARPNTT